MHQSWRFSICITIGTTNYNCTHSVKYYDKELRIAEIIIRINIFDVLLQPIIYGVVNEKILLYITSSIL